jgi:hypothetical protein
METLARPHHPWLKAANFALRVLLSLLMVGCAATRPKPTVTEARTMETRSFPADAKTAMSAAVNALQDLRYTVDVANNDLGLITASRQTSERSGEITREPENPESGDGMPTWAKVALIVTGVILIVFLVAAISGDKDEDDAKTKSYDSGSSSSSTTTVIERDESGETVYSYRVTVNCEAHGQRQTRVRVSTQGSRQVGGKVAEAGPVNDPEFFQRFFASLDKSLFLEKQELKP